MKTKGESLQYKPLNPICLVFTKKRVLTICIQYRNSNIGGVGKKTISYQNVEVVSRQFFSIQAFCHVQFTSLSNLELRARIA